MQNEIADAEKVIKFSNVCALKIFCLCKFLIFVLHNFADKASDNTSYEATEEGDWDGNS